MKLGEVRRDIIAVFSFFLVVGHPFASFSKRVCRERQRKLSDRRSESASIALTCSDMKAWITVQKSTGTATEFTESGRRVSRGSRFAISISRKLATARSLGS